MYKESIIVADESGLQTRPASLFAERAARFNSDIKVVKGGHSYNGKCMMGLISMGLKKGDKLTIEAVGIDAYEAVKELVGIIYKEEV